MMEGERLIAAESTANLRRGLLEGYILIVTDRRMVGFKSLKSGVLGVYSFAEGMADGIHGAERSLREKAMNQASEILSRKDKDFEIAKEEIVHVELSPPGHVRNGLLRIVPRSGDPIDLGIRVTTAGHPFYRRLVATMQSFAPDRLIVHAKR